MREWQSGMADGLTVQVNLSPGDLPYAELTVPRLLCAHPEARRRLLVVDCTRPQRTKIVDPESRFPEPAFTEKTGRLVQLAESFKERNLADDVVYLRTGDDTIQQLSQKYLAGRLDCTHDYGGCALMAYLFALEAPTTRYAVHYDADILLYTRAAFDWTREAIDVMSGSGKIVAATPRISPPFTTVGSTIDAPSRREVRRLERVANGWLNDWFSTRCFLIDRVKLSQYLPLLRGRIYLETLLVKWLNRGYPRSPEILLFRTVGGSGGRRLNLMSDLAWFIHPSDKGGRFLALLPRILEKIVVADVPDEQCGEPELLLDAWAVHCEQDRTAPSNAMTLVHS